jgi:hypothetical protein
VLTTPTGPPCVRVCRVVTRRARPGRSRPVRCCPCLLLTGRNLRKRTTAVTPQDDSSREGRRFASAGGPHLTSAIAPNPPPSHTFAAASRCSACPTPWARSASWRLDGPGTGRGAGRALGERHAVLRQMPRHPPCCKTTEVAQGRISPVRPEAVRPSIGGPMLTLLWLVPAWFLASLPAGLLLGRIFAAGDGQVPIPSAKRGCGRESGADLRLPVPRSPDCDEPPIQVRRGRNAAPRRPG